MKTLGFISKTIDEEKKILQDILLLYTNITYFRGCVITGQRAIKCKEPLYKKYIN
jgi:hypothetical protein